jgi:hypothetical protein
LSFEAGTYLSGFIDLGLAADCLGNTVPDSRKSPTNGCFELSDVVVERLVGRREQKRDLVDAQERISVEDEGDEELAGSEFRIVERRSPRVRGFPVAAATPDTVRSVECVECFLLAVWTRSRRPDLLETPLDDGVERLGPKLYCSQFHKFR